MFLPFHKNDSKRLSGSDLQTRGPQQLDDHLLNTITPGTFNTQTVQIAAKAKRKKCPRLIHIYLFYLGTSFHLLY